MPFSTQAPTVSNAVGDLLFRSPEAEALGLEVDPATGTISGTMEESGTYVVDLNVTDSTDRVTSEPVTIDILPNLRLTVNPVYATVNTAMNPVRAVVAEYALGAVTYEILGDLPAGMLFSETTGKIYFRVVSSTHRNIDTLRFGGNSVYPSP